MLFDFEKTEIGGLVRELNREVAGLLDQLPQRAHESADNLQRAAKSLGRNLAEGWGKWQIRDKLNFFQTGRGSGTEIIASLNELVDYRYATEEQVRRARMLTSKIVACIIGLIRYWEKQPPRDRHGAKRRAKKGPEA